MIAKCIVVLAIVAQINGQICSCIGSGHVGSTGGGISTRNIVARGQYSVALQHSGPTINKCIPATSSHVQTPIQTKPTIRLPACIPPPRTVSHTCTCYKTIMRPRVHEQLITVPSVQRYLETTHKPVVENIHYEACPTNSMGNLNGGFGGIGGAYVGSCGTVIGGSCGSVIGGSCGVSVVPVAPAPVCCGTVAPVQVASPVCCGTVAPVSCESSCPSVGLVGGCGC